MRISNPVLILLPAVLLLLQASAANRALLADDLAQPGPTFTVNTTDEHDDGICGEDDCTLHEAITAANANTDLNQVVFAVGLAGTITTDKLDAPNGISIENPVTITGPGARLLTISGNHAARVFFGGFTQVEIDGLTIADGMAIEGAINTFGQITLNNCIVTGNTASDFSSGGGIRGQDGSSIVLNQCTFSGNTAGGSGGAVSGFAVTATNCTFTNNSAMDGGALALAGNDGVSLLACTITGNHAAESGPNAGGGVFYGGSNCTVDSCIIAGNTSSDMVAPEVAGTFNSAGYNLIGVLSGGSFGFTDGVNNDHVGTSDAPLAAGLDPAGLQNNAGPTDTIALLPDSLAVNAGDPINAPERDQRDYDRVDAPDIGAFELGATIPRALANISTRLLVETGDNVLIGGFIVTGTHSKSVLLRAIGPSLPLDGKLPNPVLELHDGLGVIVATNDDWETNSNQQEIIDTGIAPTDPLESVLLLTLDPGLYTAIVSGANSETGIALIEAYDLDRTTDAKLANISTRGFV